MDKIKPAYLRLDSSCDFESPDDVKRLIRHWNEGLQVKTVPVEYLSQKEITIWYSGLYETISRFEEAKNRQELDDRTLKTHLDDIVDSILDVYEFQAACYVAQDANYDVESLAKNQSEIRKRFLDHLYENKERYKFFNEREKTVDKLIDLGAIFAAKYKR